jgi:hypothetical protein
MAGSDRDNLLKKYKFTILFNPELIPHFKPFYFSLYHGEGKKRKERTIYIHCNDTKYGRIRRSALESFWEFSIFHFLIQPYIAGVTNSVKNKLCYFKASSKSLNICLYFSDLEDASFFKKTVYIPH